MGHRCLICPEATIIHYGGASEKVRAGKMVRLFTAKAMLFDRHWSPPWRWFGVFCLDLWAFTRMTALALASRIQRRRDESYRTWRDIWGQRGQWHRVSIRHGQEMTESTREVA